jgi:hypothetical protein
MRYALFIRAKWKRTSDELLSSEDLKEEKVVTTPPLSIRDICPPAGLLRTSGASRSLAHRPLRKRAALSLCSAFLASNHMPV